MVLGVTIVTNVSESSCGCCTDMSAEHGISYVSPVADCNGSCGCCTAVQEWAIMTVSSASPVVAGCNGSESNGIMMFMFSVEYLVGKLINDNYYYTHTLQQLL